MTTVTYPTWLYHRTAPERIVYTVEQHDALQQQYPGLWTNDPRDLHAPDEPVSPPAPAPEKKRNRHGR